MTRTKRRSRSRDHTSSEENCERRKSTSPIRRYRNISKQSPDFRSRRSSRKKPNFFGKNKAHNHVIGLLKRNERNFDECCRIVKDETVRGGMNSKIGKFYLNLIVRSIRSHSAQLHYGSEFIKMLIDSNVSCDSNLFYQWVIMQRNAGNICSSEILLGQIRKLNIHRPSFKLLASLITTYCTFAIRFNKKNYQEAIRNCEHARDVFNVMREQYKYTPNTYLLNSLLNMYCKLNLKEDFWDLVLIICTEMSVSYDAFTYGSLLEMCLKEGNFEKMEDVYRCFRKGIKGFNNCENDKNIQYVNSLYQRMKEKKKSSLFDVEIVREKNEWKNYYEKNVCLVEEESDFEKIEVVKKKQKKDIFDVFGGENVFVMNLSARCD